MNEVYSLDKSDNVYIMNYQDVLISFSFLNSTSTETSRGGVAMSKYLNKPWDNQILDYFNFSCPWLVLDWS